MQKHWYFIRHGQTDYNKKGIIQGSGVDSSLNETGQAQASAFYEKYKHLSFDCIITSSLKRTAQTVQPFIDSGISWEQTADINEMNWGIHEDQKGEPWMIKNYQQMISDWGAGNLDARIEAGESARELVERSQRFINALKNRSEERILICSHGRSLRSLLMVLKNQEIADMESYSPSNTALYQYRFDQEGLHIEVENDLSHLAKLPG